MTKGFKRVLMYFKSTTENTTGEQLLNEVSGYFDTDSADVEIEDFSLKIQFVTADSQDDMLERCNSIKQRVDSALHERLFYKIIVMSL